MLPAAARLTSSADFRLVTRTGRRAGRARLVVHAVSARPAEVTNGTDPQQADVSPTPRVGFVVSKAVGNSVVRHRVSRRLRHVVADRLGTLSPGSSLVVRALPQASSASSAELGADFDAAVKRLRLVVGDNGGAA